jgi:hypothetical protein
MTMADNALVRRRAQQWKYGNPAGAAATPEDELQAKMIEHGYEGGDPVEGMKHVWEKEPTDSNAELIDHVSKKHGWSAPWDKAGKR